MKQSSVPGRDISAKVKRSVNSGKQLPGTVVEVFFDKVRVQLSGNGQILNNLPVIGGPVDAGQSVMVDYSTTPPQAVAIGKTWLTSDDLEAALKRMGNETASAEATISIVLFSGGASLEMFDPSADGLESAMNAAVEGDVIWLPDTSISYDLEVKDGVTVAGVSSRETIIAGKVTLGENSTIENLKVVATSSYADTIAVQVNATKTQAIIRNCEIHGYHCRDGNTTAISMAANALLDLSYTLVVGHATQGGIGTCITFVAGSVVEATYSRFWANSVWFTGTGTVNEHANTEGFDESEIWCGPPGTTFYPSYGMVYGESTGPAPYNSKSGHIIISPTSADLYAPAPSQQANSFTRYGDYIYFVRYVTSGQFWVREYNILTGATVDMQAPVGVADFSNGQYALVDSRKIVVIRPTSHPSLVGFARHEVYTMDFSTSTTTIVAYIDDTVGAAVPRGAGGSYSGGHGYWSENKYYKMAPYAIKDENGDTILLIVGKYELNICYNIDTAPADSTLFEDKNYLYVNNFGRFVAGMNWTQSGPWYIKGSPATNVDGPWINYDTSNDDFDVHFVAGKYIVIPGHYPTAYRAPRNSWSDQAGAGFVKFVQEDGLTRTFYYDGTTIEANYETGYSYPGYWTFSIADLFNVLKETAGSFTYMLQGGSDIWADGIDAFYSGVDHLNEAVFFTATPSNSATDFVERVWRVDAATGSFAIHYTAVDDTIDIPIVNNGSNCYLLVYDSGTAYVVMDADSLSTVNPAWNDTNNNVANGDMTLDDNNGFLWGSDGTSNLFVGYNLVDGASDSFDPGFDMSPYTTVRRVRCFGDVFIFIGWNTSTSRYNWKIIRSS